MGERMRVEAREPILDRMPLAYNLAWRATSARPPSARRGAHVSERFAGRAIPVLSNASPAPRLPAVPSRESPSSRVPSALPSSACRFGWRHPLVEGSPADGSLSRAGDECGVYRRFRVRGDDGTTTALLPDRARRGLLPFREEQEVSPPSPGRGSDGWTAAPSGLAGESLRGSRAESQPHAPRACTPPSQGEKILSARRAGQAGRRAGSGKTIPRLARDTTLPSREAVRRAPPTHARLASTPRKTRGRPLTRLPSGP